MPEQLNSEDPKKKPQAHDILSEDPKKKPQAHAGGDSKGKKSTLLYVVLGILLIAGVYLYLSSKKYLPKLY